MCTCKTIYLIFLSHSLSRVFYRNSPRSDAFVQNSLLFVKISVARIPYVQLSPARDHGRTRPACRPWQGDGSPSRQKFWTQTYKYSYLNG